MTLKEMVKLAVNGVSKEDALKYDKLGLDVDTIIEAADTRKYVIGAFEMLYTKREDRPSKKHGTV